MTHIPQVNYLILQLDHQTSTTQGYLKKTLNQNFMGSLILSLLLTSFLQMFLGVFLVRKFDVPHIGCKTFCKWDWSKWFQEHSSTDFNLWVFSCQEFLVKIVVWTDDTYKSNLVIYHKISSYLKEICIFRNDENFPFKYIL